MKRTFAGLAALGFMVTAFLLTAVAAEAQSVDDKIKALEQELSRSQVATDRIEEGINGGGSGLADFQLSSRQRSRYFSGRQVLGHSLLDGCSPPHTV